MKKVYICSPCRGDYENNIQRAREFSRAAVMQGCIPITPHIYLTQFVDDTIPAERELGLTIGRELVLMCDELWAFGIDCPTAGMAAEIELANERGIPVFNGYERITSVGDEPAAHTDDERIEFGRLTKEQRDDLEHHHKLGAIAFVLVSMGMTECFRVPWPVWRDMASIYGRKYMTRDELQAYKVPVVAGFVKFLDKLPPEVVTVKDLTEEELERLKQMLKSRPATIIAGEVTP